MGGHKGYGRYSRTHFNTRVRLKQKLMADNPVCFACKAPLAFGEARLVAIWNEGPKNMTGLLTCGAKRCLNESRLAIPWFGVTGGERRLPSPPSNQPPPLQGRICRAICDSLRSTGQIPELEQVEASLRIADHGTAAAYFNAVLSEDRYDVRLQGALWYWQRQQKKQARKEVAHAEMH